MKLPIITPLQNLTCDTTSEPLYLASTLGELIHYVICDHLLKFILFEQTCSYQKFFVFAKGILL